MWDLRTDTAGPELSVDALRSALETLLTTVLAAGAEPEAHEESDVVPEGLADMTLQDAVTYMWDVLDKGNRVDWGDGGFTLDLQQRGKYGTDRCPRPMFDYVNTDHAFWSAPVTKAFIALLDNYEREVGVAETVTSEEKREMGKFLDALGATKVGGRRRRPRRSHGAPPFPFGATLARRSCRTRVCGHARAQPAQASVVGDSSKPRHEGMTASNRLAT